MKEIKAYIRPEKANDVISALEKNGVSGMTVINVSVLGKWVDENQSLLSMDFCRKYCNNIKIELICEDEEVEKFISAIIGSAKTGKKGDGKVFVSDIEKAVSVRTEKEGVEAIK